MCSLRVSQVFLSLANEGRPRPKAPGPSGRLGWAGLQWKGLPDLQGLGLLLEGWFSQRLPRVPAFQQSSHAPRSTTLPLKGFPDSGRSSNGGGLGEPVVGALHPWGKQGMGRERETFLLPRALHYKPRPPVCSHTHQTHHGVWASPVAILPAGSTLPSLRYGHGNLTSTKHLALSEVIAQHPTRFSGHIQ